MAEPIRLEPHSAFKKAIEKKDARGYITYNYYKLIDVCMELHGFDEEEAIEWVGYNILGTAINGFDVSYTNKAE